MKKHITIRVDEKLLAAIEEMAAKQYRNRTNMIEILLFQAVPGVLISDNNEPEICGYCGAKIYSTDDLTKCGDCKGHGCLSCHATGYVCANCGKFHDQEY